MNASVSTAVLGVALSALLLASPALAAPMGANYLYPQHMKNCCPSRAQFFEHAARAGHRPGHARCGFRRAAAGGGGGISVAGGASMAGASAALTADAFFGGGSYSPTGGGSNSSSTGSLGSQPPVPPPSISPPTPVPGPEAGSLPIRWLWRLLR